ncbi:cysteine--tRNA ligase [Aerobium aerolatum]|uniref:Cysteine--tRNA ligase n=1 Tax=Aquamicrobium aerolatum DSM 21857 TaxID=1121003 RepID=A0A1I3N5V7_9HYPH|nr:cysteine--tRNA ligase [Aquamicrobium aerolatum]SFJ04475.1 cysteinyl-tRNA synthetase [Aquamicrobium aerolatum DSM 21857]
MSESVATLRLYNTLTRTKEDFAPIDPKNVRMYVCGPTVYDFAHIGNARPVIVFDVLNRLLRHVYGEAHVTYVRNITDVDDKINARALRDFGNDISSGALSLNAAIRKVTEKTATQFHADVKRLGCLEPDFEPRATEHIDGMVEMAQALIDKGNAYVATGAEGREVLFDVSSMPDYGKLSNRRLDEQQAGARIEIKDHKRNPGDFVLWKESAADQPGWPAHFHADGQHLDIYGRPGWHIECSVMSAHHLGNEFDIHGGGLDLIFPHHENEIAQSRCAHGTAHMASVWMHNGFVQVEGRKMSKSEGNFVTINELLDTDKFGGRKWPGEVLRLAMLMTHYREPIDFSVRRLEEAESIIKNWRTAISVALRSREFSCVEDIRSTFVVREVLENLGNDLDTYSAIRALSGNLRWLVKVGADERPEIMPLLASLKLLGFENLIENVVNSRTSAEQPELVAKIEERLDFIRNKNWSEADRIRDELAAQGVQLKDGKDPATGERVTTWEVIR